MLWSLPLTIRIGRGSSPDVRFLEKHEERMVEEQKFLREAAEEKYRRTHDYNIIAGTYYDQNKEENFVRSREQLGAMQGRAQQYRLPPSIRYGEGNDYNIISQQVRGESAVFCLRKLSRASPCIDISSVVPQRQQHSREASVGERWISPLHPTTLSSEVLGIFAKSSFFDRGAMLTRAARIS